MAKAEDITVTIRAIDKVSPVVRRIRWGLFLYQHGTAVIVGMAGTILALATILAFVLGRVSA